MRLLTLALLLAACEPAPTPDIAVVLNEHTKDFYNTWSIRGELQNNFDHATEVGLRAVFLTTDGDTTYVQEILPKRAEAGEVVPFEFRVSSEAANGADTYRLFPVVE